MVFTLGLLFASHNSARSSLLLMAASIILLVIVFRAPSLFVTLAPHDPAQPAPPLKVTTVIPIPDPVPNIPSDHQPDTQQAPYVGSTKPESKIAKPEYINPRTDTSEYNKEFTNKPAGYFIGIRQNNTSLQAKKVLEPYGNALFKFSGKVKNISSLIDAIAVLITTGDGYPVYCMYPKSSIVYLSRLGVGDAISGVGTINDELELPAVVLYGCHSTGPSGHSVREAEKRMLTETTDKLAAVKPI